MMRQSSAQYCQNHTIILSHHHHQMAPSSYAATTSSYTHKISKFKSLLPLYLSQRHHINGMHIVTMRMTSAAAAAATSSTASTTRDNKDTNTGINNNNTKWRHYYNNRNPKWRRNRIIRKIMRRHMGQWRNDSIRGFIHHQESTSRRHQQRHQMLNTTGASGGEDFMTKTTMGPNHSSYNHHHQMSHSSKKSRLRSSPNRNRGTPDLKYLPYAAVASDSSSSRGASYGTNETPGYQQHHHQQLHHSQHPPFNLFPNILYILNQHPLMDYFIISSPPNHQDSNSLYHIYIYKFLLVKDDWILNHLGRCLHLRQLFPEEMCSNGTNQWIRSMVEMGLIKLHYRFICHHIIAASHPKHASGYYLREQQKSGRKSVAILTSNNSFHLREFCRRHGFTPLHRNYFLPSRRELMKMPASELLHMYSHHWRMYPSLTGRIYEQLIASLIRDKASFEDILLGSSSGKIGSSVTAASRENSSSSSQHSDEAYSYYSQDIHLPISPQHTGQDPDNSFKNPTWIHDYELDFNEIAMDTASPHKHGEESLNLLLRGETNKLVFCRDRHRVDILGLLKVKEGTESFDRYGPHKIPLVVQITHQQIKLLNKVFSDWVSNDVYHFSENSGLSHAIANFYLLRDRTSKEKKKTYRAVRVIAAHHLEEKELEKFLKKVHKRQKRFQKGLQLSKHTGVLQMEDDSTYLSIWSMQTNKKYAHYWRQLEAGELL